MKQKWYLGKTKGLNSHGIWMDDFEWQCGWYWSGGYIGNFDQHCHFDGCFLKIPDYRGHPLGNFKPQTLSNGAAIWEPLSTFLDDVQYDANQWWRIKDLFKQFYTLKQAAEVFQFGGHCTSTGRLPEEINKEMAEKINNHLKNVIIPAIRKAMNKE